MKIQENMFWFCQENHSDENTMGAQSPKNYKHDNHLSFHFWRPLSVIHEFKNRLQIFVYLKRYFP